MARTILIRNNSQSGWDLVLALEGRTVKLSARGNINSSFRVCKVGGDLTVHCLGTDQILFISCISSFFLMVIDLFDNSAACGIHNHSNEDRMRRQTRNAAREAIANMIKEGKTPRLDMKKTHEKRLSTAQGMIDKTAGNLDGIPTLKCVQKIASEVYAEDDLSPQI